MKKIVVLILLIIGSISVKAQFPTTDSLRSFINRYIRNSAVEAFQNLRLNTALIGMTNYIDSAYGGQVVSFTAPNDSTARIITLGGDTMDIVIRGNPPSITLTNTGTGYSLVATPNGSIKRLSPGYGVLMDSTTTANSITIKADTTGSNPLVTTSDLNDALAAGGGGSPAIRSDLGHLPQIKTYMPAAGINASANTSSAYSYTSVDSARYKFTSTGIGNENGGWLASGTSGDSILVTAPFWIMFGDSQAEGHPGLHGRVHAGGLATFDANYADQPGQLSYHLRYLTNMRWFNHGIGGQTTVDMRTRFARDVLGDSAINSGDGRGNRTLNYRPQGVVIIAGINDIFNGVPIPTLKANLEWMAAACQERNIRCVILNIPGDALANQAQLRMIASVNEWLRSGIMDKYNACVVDYNYWWNDPTYGGDNIHHTALITDDIHPSLVGYDSLANFIYREAKLPRLTKAIFYNELDPGGFSGYSRPANITIDANPYTISAAIDSIDITTYVPDQVWVKITSSTNVTGTSFTGFSHILWKQDNNVPDSVLYTRRTFANSGHANPSFSSIDVISETGTNNTVALRVRMNDLNETLRATTSGSGGQLILNGLSNTGPLNSAALSVYKSSGYAIATDGNIIAAGGRSQISNLELMNNGQAINTGFGISHQNALSSIEIQGTPSQGKELLRVTTYNSGVSNLGTNPVNLLSVTGAGFGISTDIDQRGNALSLTPTINHNTSANAGIIIRGLYYKPTITNLGNARHNGIVQATGNNYLNETSDSTCYGCAESAAINAKFRVNGSIRFDLGSDANYDLYYRNSSGLLTRLPASTDGYVLTTHSTSSAPTWEAGAGAAVLKGTTSWTPGVVAAGSSATTNITVTGASPGDPVTVSKATGGYGNGELYDAFVSASNTVTIRVHNVSTGSANYNTSETYNVVVLKY